MYVQLALFIVAFLVGILLVRIGKGIERNSHR